MQFISLEIGRQNIKFNVQAHFEMCVFFAKKSKVRTHYIFTGSIRKCKFNRNRVFVHFVHDLFSSEVDSSILAQFIGVPCHRRILMALNIQQIYLFSF